MKKWLTLCTVLCVVLSASAQDTLRPYSVKVVDRKGKPIPGLVVSVASRGSAFVTNEKGLVELEAVSDADSLIVFLPNIGETHIPCKGTDSVQITVRSKTRFRVQDRKEVVNLRANPSNTIENVPNCLKASRKNLAELLSGQIPVCIFQWVPAG